MLSGLVRNGASRSAGFRTGNQAQLRQQNLSGIMQHLYENAPISRAALAKLTGLNKTTVSSLINELIENQFVLEIGAGSSTGAGRRSVLLDINPARGCIVSGEIGVDFISVVCTNFAAEIVWRHNERISSEAAQETILDRTLVLLHRAAASGSSRDVPLLGLTLGVPGLVDTRNGRLLFAPNLGWKDVPLRETLQKSFRTMIFVDNEANLAALGEQYFGAAEGYNEVLYVHAAVGLGGGMVLNGRLYSGSAGFAGEFGHMTLEPEGELCKCGNRGCWETLVSQPALFRHIQSAINKGAISLLADKLDSDRLTVEAVVEAARQNDSVARDALTAVGRYLGIGVASLVNTLNPSLVVVGGILSLAADFLLPPAIEELHRRALRWTDEKAKVIAARYGSDACVMGGVARVYQEVLANPPLQESRIGGIGVAS